MLLSQMKTKYMCYFMRVTLAINIIYILIIFFYLITFNSCILCISQYLKSDEQPCTQEEHCDCKRCLNRIFAMNVHAATEFLDTLGGKREKVILELSFI